MELYEHGGDIYGDENILLDFSVSTNPLGMPDLVKQAIISHIPEYACYPDPCCRKLRAALAERNGLEDSMVLCGSGAMELIFALCACFKPRSTVVLAPTFSEYQRAAEVFGGQVKEHRLLETGGFALTDSILADLTPQVDLMFMCNPNNPTGQLADPVLLRKIAEACGENEILLIIDECFLDFTRQGESMLAKIMEYPNLMILQAFTKIYAMAGLRLGTLYCADQERLANIAEFMPPWSVSAVAQAAGIAALQEKGWMENTRRIVDKERGFMEAALGELGLVVYPSDANYLLIKSERPLYRPLKSRGILVRSGVNFSGLGEEYIRIGIQTRDNNRVLLDVMREVLNG
ncbi:MAG: aminotransferase class I/II-fold pyridoxal phosphate-dependent enzyme [Syntrophomonadaceae bacterium]|nr:aminotransferase class I/II-fold pyridoxal phosphate-dependent enzyme [Syntrophomonadaceae bacterium]